MSKVLSRPRLYDKTRVNENVHLTTSVVFTGPPVMRLNKMLIPDPFLVGMQSICQVRQFLKWNAGAISVSKWAPCYLQYVDVARQENRITKKQFASLAWLIGQYAIRDHAVALVLIERGRQVVMKKLINMKIAVQVLTQVDVIKYGRKGRPHRTRLVLNAKNEIKWMSKMSIRGNVSKGFSFNSVLHLYSGHRTKVFLRAMEKGLAGDPDHCLSIVTVDRTLDLRAKSKAQRDWLFTSFKKLVAQAAEQQQMAIKHVELNIIEKLKTIPVIKHGRKGKPHQTYLHVNRNGELTWKSRNKSLVLLEDIECVKLGARNSTFARSKNILNKHCLSVEASDRGLHLQLQNEELRDWMAIAIEYLANKFKERQAEICRQQKEKEKAMQKKLTLFKQALRALPDKLSKKSHREAYRRLLKQNRRK